MPNNIFILNIETSATDCSISLALNGKSISYQASESAWKHSREITILIKKALDEAQLDFQQLTAVAVSQGPGSYTGLRVGSSAAKAICYAWNIPLLGIETLKIIAKKYIAKISEKSYIIPVIDARRDEVYYQILDFTLESDKEADNLILNNNSFHTINNTNSIICGNAALKAKELMQNSSFNYINSAASAIDMVDLSYQAFLNKNFENLAYFRPFYLKPPNITKSKKPLF